MNAKDEVKLYGYAIAIPDVRNLAAFCQHFPSILQQRDSKELWGKPRSAIVRNLVEAGLDSLGSIHTYLSKLRSHVKIRCLNRHFSVADFFKVKPKGFTLIFFFGESDTSRNNKYSWFIALRHGKN